MRPLVIVAAVALAPSTASAHLDVARAELALARVCISEIGWEPGEECAAIHAVIVDRAERMGIPYMQALCAYASRSCSPGRTDARRWIAHLDASLERPDGWPASLPWSRYRERWAAALDLAGHVLGGRVTSPCELAPHHWGMPHGIDLERARLAGWERVSCPGARNAYWRDPRRGGSARYRQHPPASASGASRAIAWGPVRRRLTC